MKTIINENTGKVLFASLNVVELQENEIAIDELLTENFVVPYFNQETREFYEGATEEEITEANKPIVPFEVALWKIRAVLKLMNLETTIESALNELDEPTKTGALYIWQFGTSIDRSSPTIAFIQAILEMTDEQVDNIFIQANEIIL